MNRPAPVEVCYKSMRFLITHNPTNATLSSFIEVRLNIQLGDMEKYRITIFEGISTTRVVPGLLYIAFIYLFNFLDLESAETFRRTQ